MRTAAGGGAEYEPQQQRRPSMISARYRQREERRRVLKISASKLRKIEDPEASLCRSVLINNTMRQLQREAGEGARARRPRPEPTVTVAAATDLALDLGDDCDMLLAHLYVPPAPRLLTCIDDETAEPLTTNNNNTTTTTTTTTTDDSASSSSTAGTPPAAKRAKFDETLPCGRASLLGEMHAPAFRSLVASLET